MQLQITSDRIYFTNPRGEQIIIGHPPVDVVDPETVLTLAPEWMEDEPLKEGMVRKKHGALYREKRKPGKKPANESKGG